MVQFQLGIFVNSQTMTLCVLLEDNIVKSYDTNGNLLGEINKDYEDTACSVWFLKQQTIVAITEDEDDADAVTEEGRLYPLHIWDATTTTNLRMLTGHYDGIKNVIGLTGDLIASCGKDNRVRVFNYTSGDVITEYESSVYCLVSVGNNQLALVDAKQITILDVKTGKETIKISCQGVERANLRGVAVTCFENQYITNYGQTTSDLELWSVSTGELKTKISLESHIFRVVPLEHHLIIITEDNVHLYNFEEKIILEELAEYTATPVALKEPHLIAFAIRKNIIVFDVVKRQRVSEVKNKTSVDELQFVGGDVVACLDDDSSVTLWNLNEKTNLVEIEQVEELL
jgi:WD40 repeat protein